MLNHEEGISFKTTTILCWGQNFQLYGGEINMGCRHVKVLLGGCEMYLCKLGFVVFF